MAEPLVSVLVPCYDSAHTLPRALASLLAQDHETWECVLVDDGSTDRPEDVVERYADPRIRMIRLERNRGRGAARQVALDEARGELIAMLDADDWIYPWKLRVQTEALRSDPSLALISSGFAIVDGDNQLMGCRQSGRETGVEVRGPHRSAHPPRVPFGPVMLRTADGRRAGFDPSLERAQDADFLQRLLHGRRYGLWGEPLYAYAEHHTYSLETMTTAFRCRRAIYRKEAIRHPVESRVGIARDTLKLWAYRLAFAVGAGDRMRERRSSEPTPRERERFLQARAAVDARMVAP